MSGSNQEILEDLKKLITLKDKFGTSYNKGDLIFFAGQPADDFGVVLKGRVQLDVSGGREIAGPGDLFGELEVFTGQPRKEQATAVEDALVLLFNRETAVELLGITPRFGLLMIQRCCEKLARVEGSRGASSQVASPSAPAETKAQVPVEAAPEKVEAASVASSDETIGPVYDVDYKPAIWKKDFKCPNCGAQFGAWNVRANFINVDNKDTDGMTSYKGVNPELYAIWVCPNCYLAAFADDFPQLNSVDVARIKPALQTLLSQGGPKYDFSRYRDVELAVRSFQLAVPSYETKRGAMDKVGRLYRSLAWFERERGNEQPEREYMEKARECYEKAFSTQDAEKQGISWAYLVAEYSLRLGRFSDAVKWFSTASQQPGFKEQPALEKMIRDRWAEAGDLAKAARAQDNAEPAVTS